MAKEQFNFRLEAWILEKIRDRAQKQGVSVTEWMESACLAELGFSEEERELRYHLPSQRDKDRVRTLEQAVERLEQNIKRLDSRVDSTWDAIEYVSKNLESLEDGLKANRDIATDTLKAQKSIDATNGQTYQMLVALVNHLKGKGIISEENIMGN